MFTPVRGLRGFFVGVLQDLDQLTCKGDHSRFSDELYYKFMKFLETFHNALHPMHNGDIENFFISVEINRDNIKSLLQSHCLNIAKKIPNIFSVLLYAYSFAYSLMRFERRIYGHDNFMDNYMYIQNSFIPAMRGRFYGARGWAGLENYCSAQNLLFILDFIHGCYSHKWILLTFVEIEQSQKNDGNVNITKKWHPFGIHSEYTIALLMVNLGRLKNFVLSEFEIELSGYSFVTYDIQERFLKIAVDLENLIKDLIPQHAAIRDCLAEAMETFLLNLREYKFLIGTGENSTQNLVSNV